MRSSASRRRSKRWPTGSRAAASLSWRRVIATAGGGVVLIGLLFGALRFDPAVMMAAVAALLGGIVLWGSNRSTAAEAADEIAKAEQRRAALIGALELRTVAAQPRLH